MNIQRYASLMLMTGMLLTSCNSENKSEGTNILFLHHSTGGILWQGSSSSMIHSAAGKVSNRIADFLAPKGQLPALFENYNRDSGGNYVIKEQIFPKAEPYGWHNYPYDYYNIWVKNGGDSPYTEEPTLEMLTRQYQLIVFKHCFPVSNISADADTADINSNIQTLANYRLQYDALKEKLHQFPGTRFILLTGAAQVESAVSADEAQRAKEFFDWVKEEWDVSDDNIFIWDFYNLQTEGGLYFKNEYAVSPGDSHPNQEFAGTVVPLLFNRIIDVIENGGTKTLLTGEKKML